MPEYKTSCNCGAARTPISRVQPAAGAGQSGCGCRNDRMGNTNNTGGMSNRMGYSNTRMGNSGSPAGYNSRRTAQYTGNRMNNMAVSCPSTCDDQLEGLPIGMGYVPWQVWQDICDAQEGLQIGTIFAQLDKPFTECACGGGRK